MFDAAVEITAELARMLRRNRRALLLVQVLAALFLVMLAWKGIAWALRPGVAVSGRVTFKNAPLEAGLISFHAYDERTTGPPVAGAVVEAGRYAVATEAGIAPGKYRVQIRSLEPATGGENGSTPPARERIPASFNDRSGLVIEVGRFGRNRFDFAIP